RPRGQRAGRRGRGEGRRRTGKARGPGSGESTLRGILGVFAAFWETENLLGDQPGILPDRQLDAAGDLRIGLEERFGVLTALADALAVIGEPGAGLLHHAGLDAEVEDLAGFGDAFAVHDVELDLLERRRE